MVASFHLPNSKRSLFLLFFVLLLTSACGKKPEVKEESPKHNTSRKIVGGAVPSEDNPGNSSEVGIVNKNGRLFCSAVLISSNAVLTAAHCLHGQKKENINILFADSPSIGHPLIVAAKSFNTFFLNEKETTAFDNPIDQDRIGANFDIGIITFEEVELPAFWKPIEILLDPTHLSKGDSITLVGHGQTQTHCSGPNCIGQQLSVETNFEEYISNSRLFSLFTYSGARGKGACNGDSGGPAYVKWGDQWYLIGVTFGVWDFLVPEFNPFTHDQCEIGKGIYTFVGDYSDWIEKSLGKKLSFSPQNKKPLRETEATSLPTSFAQWCLQKDYTTPTWHAVQSILLQVGQHAPDHESKKRVFKDCLYAESLLREHLQKNSGALLLKNDPFLTTLEPLAPLADLIHELQIENLPSLQWQTLEKLSRLKKISIKGNSDFRSHTQLPLSFVGLKKIPALQSVTMVEVFAPIDLVSLSETKSLTSLTISSCALKDLKQFSTLPGFKKIQHLDLSNNSLVDVDVLASFKNLITLNLSYNEITNVSALLASSSLKKLNLTHNKLPSAIQAEIASSSPVLECTLDPTTFIDWCSLSYDELLAYSGGWNQHLLRYLLFLSGQKIALSQNDWHAQRDCNQAFETLRQLKVVDLSLDTGVIISGSKLNELLSNLSLLQTLPALEEIRAKNQHLGNLDAISELTTLQRIYLDNTRTWNLSSLKKIKSLRAITIQNGDYNSLAGLSELPWLETLTLIHTKGNSRLKNFQGLAKLPRLKSLTIEGHKIEELPLALFSKDNFPRLERIHLKNNQIKKINTEAAILPASLISIDLTNNPTTFTTPRAIPTELQHYFIF
ncbi:MAG: trypsin-like serine protease [Oligoflexia bacterium]|nr:trypsin-like serine protease [Oligoflexia bacterium]